VRLTVKSGKNPYAGGVGGKPPIRSRRPSTPKPSARTRTPARGR